MTDIQSRDLFTKSVLCVSVHIPVNCNHCAKGVQYGKGIVYSPYGYGQ